jgi:hypothetical protein
MRNTSVRDVVRDPEWLPHTYDVDGGLLTFVHVPRESRPKLRFLFDEHFQGKFPKVSAAFPDVQAEIDSADRGPIHFIFHTSFCGSTLLAKALEIPGTATSLSEPAILINVANRLIRSDDRENAARLELALRLLERPFSPQESVIAKLSNFANRAAGTVLKSRPDSRAVLLYSDLETYLISSLKRGMWGRILGRKWFQSLSMWSSLDLRLRTDEILELTDMQVASLAWLMQIHHFAVLAKSFGSQVMLLESSELFADPAARLHQVSTLFGLGLTQKDNAEIAAGPIFAKHSKFTDRDYSNEERRRDSEKIGAANAEEISMVTKWLETFAQHHGVSLRPSA